MSWSFLLLKRAFFHLFDAWRAPYFGTWGPFQVEKTSKNILHSAPPGVFNALHSSFTFTLTTYEVATVFLSAVTSVWAASPTLKWQNCENWGVRCKQRSCSDNPEQFGTRFIFVLRAWLLYVWSNWWCKWFNVIAFWWQRGAENNDHTFRSCWKSDRCPRAHGL